MGHHQQSPLPRQLIQEPQHLLPHRPIQARGGFIKQQHPWIAQQLHRQGQAPLLAATETLRGLLQGDAGKAHLGQDLLQGLTPQTPLTQAQFLTDGQAQKVAFGKLKHQATEPTTLPGRHGLVVPEETATVGFSLIGVILFGSLAGAMLPFLLRAVRFDPAVASAPLVATLVDVTGLVIYFTIASQVLQSTILAPSKPGIVVMEHEKSADTFARFLGMMPKDGEKETWSVQRIEWMKDRDTVVVTVVVAALLAVIVVAVTVAAVVVWP